MYVEMTLEEAEKYLKNSKYKKVLVSIQNLEENDVQKFTPRLKEECLEIIRRSRTFVKCGVGREDAINAFSEKQNIFKIKNKGSLSTFLLNLNPESISFDGE